MADVKISALPASTTPLAGTEVLPIVQGTTTKQVAVSDLTAGRAVSVSSLAATSGVTAPNLQGPSFSAYQSATYQTISSATNTLVVIDGKEFDTKTCFNNTASPVTLNGLTVPAYAFCPNVAGYYQVNALIGYYQSWITTTASLSAIYKNGSLFKSGPTIVSSYPLSNFSDVSALIYLNGTGDYIQFYSYITVGTTVFNNAQNTYFQAVFVQ